MFLLSFERREEDKQIKSEQKKNRVDIKNVECWILCDDIGIVNLIASKTCIKTIKIPKILPLFKYWWNGIKISAENILNKCMKY